jgi:hypothetical protein
LHDTTSKPGIVVCDLNRTMEVSTNEILHFKFKFLPFDEMPTDTIAFEYMKKQVALGRRVFGLFADGCILQCTSYIS